MNKVQATPHAAPPRLICPTCGEVPAQRIDTDAAGETVASCVCREGHLYVIQWRADQ